MKVGRKPLNQTCSCGARAAAKGLCMPCYQAKRNLVRYPNRVKRETREICGESVPVIIYPPRPCMECSRTFNPQGPFNRRCHNCNNHFAHVGGKDIRSRFIGVAR